MEDDGSGGYVDQSYSDPSQSDPSQSDTSGGSWGGAWGDAWGGAGTVTDPSAGSVTDQAVADAIAASPDGFGGFGGMTGAPDAGTDPTGGWGDAWGGGYSDPGQSVDNGWGWYANGGAPQSTFDAGQPQGIDRTGWNPSTGQYDFGHPEAYAAYDRYMNSPFNGGAGNLTPQQMLTQDNAVWEKNAYQPDYGTGIPYTLWNDHMIMGFFNPDMARVNGQPNPFYGWDINNVQLSQAYAHYFGPGGQGWGIVGGLTQPNQPGGGPNKINAAQTLAAQRPQQQQAPVKPVQQPVKQAPKTAQQQQADPIYQKASAAAQEARMKALALHLNAQQAGKMAQDAANAVFAQAGYTTDQDWLQRWIFGGAHVGGPTTGG